MPLLIDECVRRAVSDVLKQRGHSIKYVLEELGQSTPDQLVAEAADQSSRILVTYNYSHFKQLLSRRPADNQQKFRHAGLISFEKCKDSKTDTLIIQTIESIEFEYEQALKQRTSG